MECSWGAELKNFPHQVASLDKFLEALRVAAQILDAGGDFASDAIYGDALAYGGVHSFRDAGNLSIAQLLARELQKPAANRGSRTAARDHRRALKLFGLISGNGLTPIGRQLLDSPTNEVRLGIWREAMLALSIGDDENKSHPYRILLRLVYDHPGIEKRKLLLALEAQNDSLDEYNRILDLSDLPYNEVIDQLGISQHNAANSIKVLPGIAEQLGDVFTTGNKLVYPKPSASLANETVDEVGIPKKPPRTNPSRRNRNPTLYTATNIAPSPAFQNNAQNIVDLYAAIQLRQRRTEEHQSLVTKFAHFLEENGYNLYANPYDCLASKDESWLLIEAKTLDGSPTDSRRQAEKALGQLRGYAFFDLPEGVEAMNVRHIILFSQKPSEEIANFLKANGFEVVWESDALWTTLGANNDPALFAV